MGIQDIIDNGEKDIPVPDSYEDDVIVVDDFPVIYSDTSSDTASIDDVIDDYLPPAFEEDELRAGNYVILPFEEEEEEQTDHSDAWLSNSGSCSDSTDDSQSGLDVVVIVNLPPQAQKTEHEDVEKLQANLFKKIKNVSSKNKSNMGKRKARRFENARQLDLLTNEIGSEDVDIEELMPFHCSFRFTQILEDSDLTNKILNPVNNSKDEEIRREKCTNKRKNLPSQKDKKITASAAFNNLDSSEKTFFKRRNLPMGMVHYLDSCVYSFFQNDPNGIYVSEPLSSYERMMLHGIAHYYRLNSFSYNVENQEVRLTKVTNNYAYFNPPCLCLSQYLEQEIHKTCNKFEHSEKRRRLRKQPCLRNH